MTLYAKSFTFNTGTGAIGTTITVDNLFPEAIAPKFFIIWWSGRVDTTDTLGRRTIQKGVGVGVSTTKRFNSTGLSQDAAASAVTNKSQGTAAVMAVTTTADAIDGLLDINSMSSTNNGTIQFIIDDVFTASYTVQGVAFAGTDITNVDILAMTLSTSTGVPFTQDFTTLSFQGHLAFFVSNYGTNNSNTVTLDSCVMVGAATGSGADNQFVTVGASNDAANNMQCLSYQYNGECIAVYNTGITALETRCEFSSWLSNGLRINFLANVATARIINALVVQFTDAAMVKVFKGLTQTDTSTAINVNVGHDSAGGIIVSHCKALSAQNTPSDDDILSIGGFSSSSARNAMGISDDDAQGTSVVTTAVSFDEVLVSISPAAGTLLAEMDYTGASSPNIGFIMDDADASQTSFWGLSIGTPATSTQYNQSVDGTVTTAGLLVKQDNKVTLATLASAGALVNQANRILAGTLASTGLLINQAQKVLSGTLTSSGLLVSSKVALVSLTATLTTAGLLVKQTAASKLATLTSSGSLVNQAQKALSGTLTSVGAPVKQTQKVLVGTLASSATLTSFKVALLSLTATLTTSGALVKQTAANKLAALATAGSLVNQSQKTLTATLTSAGNLVKQAQKFLAGVWNAAASLIAQYIPGGGGTQYPQSIAGMLTTAGVLSVLYIAGTPSGLTGDTILCDPMMVSAFIAPMETDFILPMLTDVIAAMTAVVYVVPMAEDAHIQPMLIRCKD